MSNFTLSPDTQAILLLCGALGWNDKTLVPLSLAQYNVFAKTLYSLKKRPADLLELDEALIEEVCGTPSINKRVAMPKKSRIIALLRRGMALAMALDKWSSYGVRVVSRADAHYPQRMREHLKDKAPALLYYTGNERLFEGGGLAIVGARDLNAESENLIRKVVRECIKHRMPIVSGGARGADQTAIHEAIAFGGNVIGALPCDLLKASLNPSNLNALSNNNALLFTAFDPELKPFNYGAVAMDRNKYIYAMADGCLVAQSGISTTSGKSGTFEGAIEELKRPDHRPVYAFLGKSASEGSIKLLAKGAIKWDSEKSLTENINPKRSCSKSIALEEEFLPGLFPEEPTTEENVEHKDISNSQGHGEKRGKNFPL